MQREPGRSADRRERAVLAQLRATLSSGLVFLAVMGQLRANQVRFAFHGADAGNRRT
jgi:hypothetical protein